MRKIGLLMASALGLAALAAPAQADVHVTFAQNATGLVNNGVIVQNFDDITPGGVTYTSGETIGDDTKIYADTVSGMGVKPSGSTGNFAAVLGGGSYTLDFTAAPVVSFIVGSLDAYNSVVLSLIDDGTVSSQTFTGSQLGTVGDDGRITFDTGSSSLLINGITFESSTNSFEIDNIATAAPEAATWMMMILGFGIVGGALRSRRQATLAAA